METENCSEEEQPGRHFDSARCIVMPYEQNLNSVKMLKDYGFQKWLLAIFMRSIFKKRLTDVNSKSHFCGEAIVSGSSSECLHFKVRY